MPDSSTDPCAQAATDGDSAVGAWGTAEGAAPRAVHDVRGSLTAVEGFLRLLSDRYEAGLDVTGRDLLRAAFASTRKASIRLESLSFALGTGGRRVERLDRVLRDVVDWWQEIPVACVTDLKSSGDLPDRSLDGPALRCALHALIECLARDARALSPARLEIATEDRRDDETVLTLRMTASASTVDGLARALAGGASASRDAMLDLLAAAIRRLEARAELAAEGEGAWVARVRLPIAERSS